MWGFNCSKVKACIPRFILSEILRIYCMKWTCKYKYKRKVFISTPISKERPLHNHHFWNLSNIREIYLSTFLIQQILPMTTINIEVNFSGNHKRIICLNYTRNFEIPILDNWLYSMLISLSFSIHINWKEKTSITLLQYIESNPLCDHWPYL